MSTFFSLLFAWLLADFISGLVHWWEDRAIVGQSRFKFLNGVREDNERHHQQPGYLVRLTWWENINTTAPIAWGAALLVGLLGGGKLIVFTLIFLGIGNLVHRWAHEHPSKLPKAVRWGQHLGLFISASHHSGHHFVMGRLVSREGSVIRFCVMSSWLNNMLDYVGFFAGIERLHKYAHRKLGGW